MRFKDTKRGIMFKFAHIEMEKPDNPILWDRVSKDDFDLIMKCKFLYEQCLAYSGINIHEVCGCAGNLLNGTDHFLFSFTNNFINKKYDIDELNDHYKDEGGWKEHTRKFLVEEVIPRTLKAFAEK
jgi:hypothetical protein